MKETESLMERLGEIAREVKTVGVLGRILPLEFSRMKLQEAVEKPIAVSGRVSALEYGEGFEWYKQERMSCRVDCTLADMMRVVREVERRCEGEARYEPSIEEMTIGAIGG